MVGQTVRIIRTTKFMKNRINEINSFVVLKEDIWHIQTDSKHDIVHGEEVVLVRNQTDIRWVSKRNIVTLLDN